MEMEDRLAGAWADVHGEPVVLEAGPLGGLGDEFEHALRLVGGEVSDLLEAGDMALGEDEQVHVRLRVDVADRDEAVSGMDVVALGIQGAEQTVLRQRESPPR